MQDFGRSEEQPAQTPRSEREEKLQTQACQECPVQEYEHCRTPPAEHVLELLLQRKRDDWRGHHEKAEPPGSGPRRSACSGMRSEAQHDENQGAAKQERHE